MMSERVELMNSNNGVRLLRAGEHPLTWTQIDDIDRIVRSLEHDLETSFRYGKMVSRRRIKDIPINCFPGDTERIYNYFSSHWMIDFVKKLYLSRNIDSVESIYSFEMIEGDKLVMHNDQGHDLSIAVNLFLTDDYQDGDFVVDAWPGGLQSFHPGRGDIVLYQPFQEHGVREITGGMRRNVNAAYGRDYHMRAVERNKI